MPDNITDQNSVTWDQDSLNSLQLAGFNAAENAVDSVKQASHYRIMPNLSQRQLKAALMEL